MTDTTTRPLTEAELVAAQRGSLDNRDVLTGRCGCFHCLSTFTADRIASWADDGTTALCPVCGIDAVLSSATLPIAEPALAQMHRRWFETTVALAAAEWEQAVTTGTLPHHRR